MQEDRRFISWIVDTLRPDWARSLWLGIAVAINAALGGIADPLAIKWLVDSLTLHNYRQFGGIVLASILLYTGIRRLNAHIECLTQDVSSSVNERLIHQSLNSFFTLPFTEVSKRSTGYFVSRICDETTQLAGIVGAVVQILQVGILILTATTVCLWLSWKTAVALLFVVPVLRMAAKRYRHRIQAAVIEKAEREARLKEVVGQAVESYRTARIFELVEKVESQVRIAVDPYIAAVRQQTRHSASFRALSGLLLSYSELSVLVGAGIAVLRSLLTLGGLFGFVSAFGKVVGSVEGLTTLMPTLTSLDAKRMRLEAFLGTKEDCLVRALQNDRIWASGITIKREGATILTDCYVDISSKDRLLLRGPNGSGKTTLAHALCGFLPIHEGKLELPRLERISAMLTPHTFIPGTLADNLASQLKSDGDFVRFEEMREALGLKICLEDDPSRVSEGEKRKCQIIMTLMKNADFYLFDEPLANVDVATSTAVIETILRYTKDKGLVMIMHGHGDHDRLFTKTLVLSGSGTVLDNLTHTTLQEADVVFN
jgi:ABC-type multidrug transport system fused ATPase/permease subunit